MPNWKKVIVSGSDALLNSVTSSNGAYLNGNVVITGSLTVGATTTGVSENTLTLGPRDNSNEGGQLMLQAPGGTYTSASMWDNYTNLTRLLRGTNAGSDAVVASFNMHTKQVQFPQYTNTNSFPGTAAAFLAVDSSGNLITTSSAGGGGSVTINNNVDNYLITATGTINTLNGESNLQFNGSTLTVTGEITSSGAIRSLANGAMYFRGGDDAEFWDINVANTVGIYGQQTQTVGGLKLGSAGATLYGSGSRFGIGTTSPVATLDVNGNLFVASGITGSLLGTATTASYVLNAVSASFASTASSVNPLIQNVLITGSLIVSSSNGVLTETQAYDANNISSINFPTRTATDLTGISAIDWNNRFLNDTAGTIISVNWGGRTLNDSINNPILNWNSENNFYKAIFTSYILKSIDNTTQEKFSDVPTVGFNHEGEVITGTLDTGVVQFDLIYLETDGIWYQATQATADCSKLLGICIDTIRQTILLEGSLTVTSNAAFTTAPYVQAIDHGLPIYIRDGNGTLMSTIQPSTAGQYVRILGHAYYNNIADSNYWTMKFRPANDWYTI